MDKLIMIGAGMFHLLKILQGLLAGIKDYATEGYHLWQLVVV
jgi:hypothetical protein